MQGLMEFHGHTVVQPLGELSKPLIDYFEDLRLWAGVGPNSGEEAYLSAIEAWFNLDEQGKKDCIRRRGKERCFVTGEFTRTVHEIATRGANRSAALVPWNMGLVEPVKIHSLLQGNVMKMVRFDPLDTRRLNASKNEGCLIIYSPNGHLMKEDELWLYQRPKRERAEKDLMSLEADTMAMRKIAWGIARTLKRLKESGGYAEEGWEDIYMCASQHGYASARVKEMIRAAGFAERFDVDKWMELLGFSRESVGILKELPEDVSDEELLDFVLSRFLSPRVADRIRKIPDKDVSEIITLFSQQPPAEAWDRFNERYPPKGGKRKFRIMKRQPYREVYAKSIDEVDYSPGDMVEVGGAVIIGIKGEVES